MENCIYTELLNFNAKKYTFDKKLKEIGEFQNTSHRRVFLYALLETPTYEKDCRNCGLKVTDITKHGMEDCEQIVHNRKVYKLRMILYNAPENLDILNKFDVFRAALMKKTLVKVVCDFLMAIWKMNIDGKPSIN